MMPTSSFLQIVNRLRVLPSGELGRWTDLRQISVLLDKLKL
jgi:hypothetical protein